MAEYIDRTALGIGYADPKAFINPAHADGWNTAIQIINEAPAADVAPVVHGHWDKPTKPFPHYDWKCSVCGCEEYRQIDSHGKYRVMKFCPNCGAEMDEERTFKDEVDKR